MLEAYELLVGARFMGRAAWPEDVVLEVALLSVRRAPDGGFAWELYAAYCCCG